LWDYEGCYLKAVYITRLKIGIRNRKWQYRSRGLRYLIEIWPASNLDLLKRVAPLNPNPEVDLRCYRYDVILRQVVLTNDIRQLLHLYQAIRWNKCASLCTWLGIPYYHVIFIGAVLERRLTCDYDAECSFAYII